MKLHRPILSLCLLIALLPACSDKTFTFLPDENWLELAQKTEEFIQSGQIIEERGISWRTLPDSLNSQADLSLYSGSPGIVLFYLELYQATEKSLYLEKAEAGAEYLMTQIHDSLYRPDQLGLYTGLAGIGYSLSQVYRMTKRQVYLDQIERILKILKASSSGSGKGLHWGSMTDIIYGGAGIGLFLYDLSDQLNIKEAGVMADQVALALLDQAEETEQGLRWKMSPYYESYMDNFSHGTAGVAYFLCQAFQDSQNQAYLDAAILGAQTLDKIANEKGYVPHHLPGGEELFYLNWCHGPAGTSRLYYALYQCTQDTVWLDKMRATADQLMEEGIHDTHQHESLPGYWNNQGKCCGAAGVAEYYLWLFDITQHEPYLKFSEIMTAQLLELATPGPKGLKWVQAEHRSIPGLLAAQTGLMQGSAGFGLWFLELQARIEGHVPFIHLPDKPIIP